MEPLGRSVGQPAGAGYPAGARTATVVVTKRGFGDRACCFGERFPSATLPGASPLADPDPSRCVSVIPPLPPPSPCVQIPIFHCNGDDPMAVCTAFELAVEWRQQVGVVER